MTRSTDTTASHHSVAVYQSADFYVTEGVAEGDALSFADELVLDDVYQLATAASKKTITLSSQQEADRFVVAPDSAIGKPGNLVVLDCGLTLMAPDGSTSEVLVLVEVEANGVEDVYAVPLAPLSPGVTYQLVGIDRHAATTRLAEIACVSFSRGTLVTMGTGAQVRVENLQVGDRILTRDDGPQPLRWIGHTTLRAAGDFAPVRIRKGALHNANDLLLSPEHRLFIYQRDDQIGIGRPEVLVKARHLINGDTVVQTEGGFVEYFQLLFDDHQIIFAEGIAAESMLVDAKSRAILPDAARELDDQEHGHRPHLDYEVQEQMISHLDAAALLLRASKG